MWEIQDPVLVFSVLMLTFLFAPLLAEKLRLPELVLLLIAGVILGPNGFGLMKRSGGIELFGSIGLLYIMFVAGLETDAHHFKRTMKRSALFGIISFLIPQVLGTLIGYYGLNFSWMTSILLASMFASHTLIAYPIASRFGIVKNEPVVITVGGTILTNTLALLVLAVIADYSKGESLGFGFWATMLLGIVILTWAIWWILPIVASWFFRNVPEKGGAQFVFVLGMVCLCAYWSHYAKMEPIIGAFLAGVAFNRLIPAQGTLMNRLTFVGNTFFIPFFLISVGMLINPRALISSPRGILVAAVMSLTVIGTKYLAAWVTSRIFGYSGANRNVIFGLSVAQAAATLAAVLVGYELKIFDGDILNGTIVMILVTCSLGCYFVDRYGKETLTETPAIREEDANEQRILVAVSNHQTASRLLDLTFLLRNRSMNGEIYSVTIVNEMDTETSAEKIADAEKVLQECISQAASAEISISPGIRLDTNPSDGLIRAVRENRCGLLISGWNGKLTLQTRMFGSIADKLLESCPSRVFLCRLNAPLNTTRRVILPVPELGCRRSDLLPMIRDAKQLASQIGAELNLYLLREFPEEARKLILRLAPSCAIKLHTVDSWSKMEQDFIRALHPLDFLFFPLERRESALWNPRFERFAELVIETHPNVNMLAAYPVIPGAERDYLAGNPESGTGYPQTALCGVELAEEDPAGAVAAMTEQGVTVHSEEKEAIRRGLLESLKHHPFELSANAMLIHTRSESVSGCMILIGHHKSPYHLPNLNGDYNIIVALISPLSEGSHEYHLNELAKLARRFIRPDFGTAVKQAATSNEVVELLRSEN